MSACQHTLKITEAKTSLQACPGELVLITGAVGSGKSLWLKRMAGLTPPPDKVSVSIDGKSSDNAPAQTVSMLFDRWPAIWLGQHVGEELSFGLSRRPTRSEMIDRLKAWDLDGLSLSADLTSLNRRQAIRLSLAAISLASPLLVLLDNPTDSLPEQEARSLSTEVAAWAKAANLIVVVACNRWQDWQAEATQTWCIHAPEVMPQSGRQT